MNRALGLVQGLVRCLARPKVRFATSIIVANLLGISAVTSIGAAPVTLQFEATIGPPRQGFDGFVPPEWNIALQQGDNVSGNFTFEPFEAPLGDFNSHITQNYSFKLKIDSFSLETSTYQVNVIDNSVSDDEPIPMDVIRLGCTSFLLEPTCNPAQIPTGSEMITWGFNVTLIGAGELNNGPDLPADVVIWNQFSYSELLFTFSDTAIHRSTGFTASIDSFWIIPEPSTAQSLVLLCAAGSPFLAICRRRRTRPAIHRPQQLLHSPTRGNPHP